MKVTAVPKAELPKTGCQNRRTVFLPALSRLRRAELERLAGNWRISCDGKTVPQIQDHLYAADNYLYLNGVLPDGQPAPPAVDLSTAKSKAPMPQTTGTPVPPPAKAAARTTSSSVAGAPDTSLLGIPTRLPGPVMTAAPIRPPAQKRVSHGNLEDPDWQMLDVGPARALKNWKRMVIGLVSGH